MPPSSPSTSSSSSLTAAPASRGHLPPITLKTSTLAGICCGMGGVLFAWAIKNIYTTPIFKDRYDIKNANLGYVWLAGPISGLIVQPVVGGLSDRRSSKRHWIILLSSITMAASMALLPSVNLLLEWCGVSDSRRNGPAAAIAVVALWLMDLSMNAAMISLRATLADYAPQEQQAQANEGLIIAYGLGTLLGYIMGAVDVTRLALFKHYDVGNDVLLFNLSAVVLLATGSLACHCAGGIAKVVARAKREERREKRKRKKQRSRREVGGDLRNSMERIGGAWAEGYVGLELDEEEERRMRLGSDSSKGWLLGSVSGSGLREFFYRTAAFWVLPCWLWPVCLLLFFSWVGWFSLSIFASDWMGENVFGGEAMPHEGGSGGDDDDEAAYQRYEDGVRFASTAFAVQAAVIVFMGMGPIKRLYFQCGWRGTFAIMLALEAGLLLLAAGLHKGFGMKAVALLTIAALGVPMALVETVPYMMVGLLSGGVDNGQLLGKINVYVVLAELALSLAIHPIGKLISPDPAVILGMGGVIPLVGLLCVCPLVERQGDVEGRTLGAFMLHDDEEEQKTTGDDEESSEELNEEEEDGCDDEEENDFFSESLREVG